MGRALPSHGRGSRIVTDQLHLNKIRILKDFSMKLREVHGNGGKLSIVLLWLTALVFSGILWVSVSPVHTNTRAVACSFFMILGASVGSYIITQVWTDSGQRYY